ncbi:MAG: hypothetical protein JWQ29_2727 [Phenylobacterium sp.]|nr:hypothetical protein [Phenylobacterium sp.]
MHKLITLASLIGAAALSGAAGPAGQAASGPPGVDAAAKASASQCFYRRDIRNHTVADAHTLYIDVAGRDVFRIQMANACLTAANSSDPLILTDRTGSMSVCKPIDLDLAIKSGGVSHCIVSGISKLTPAEVAALPKKLRP